MEKGEGMTRAKQAELPFLDPGDQREEYAAWLNERVPNRNMVELCEVANIMGTSRNHVANLVTAGRLLAVDTSRHYPRYTRNYWRVPPSSLKLLMLANEPAPHNLDEVSGEWERQRFALRDWLQAIVPARNLRVQEVARLLNVSRRHVEALLADRQLIASDVSTPGSAVRCQTIPRDSVVAWVLTRSELC